MIILVSRVICAAATLTIALAGNGQVKSPSTDQAPIRAVMEQAAANWNKGDLVAFAHLYKQSSDILLVGPHSLTGFDAMLKFYEKNYPSAAVRGVLTYSDLQEQPLDRTFVTSTGHFHLERTKEGGGNQDGYFLVVFERTTLGWKMVRDASFLLPPPIAVHQEAQ